MPKIGEIIREKELGRVGHHQLMWCACIDCGKERWVQMIRGEPKPKLCRQCCHRGHRATRWRGGRITTAKGYVKITVPRDSFYSKMGDKYNYISEHRLVIAKHLSRCLLPWEVVHHKNGIKHDNRLENLELLAGSKYHMIDSITKGQIRRLESKIDKLTISMDELKSTNKELRREIRLLRWEQRVNEPIVNL